MLNKRSPKKSKVFCINQKPHLNKSLRAAVMKRSQLKTNANKSQFPANIQIYKKAQFGKLNKRHKKEYFENLKFATNLKPFWDKCKLYSSNKHAQERL